jgi:FtsH-binding integral membrane protein
MERRNGSTEHHGEERMTAADGRPDLVRVGAVRKPARDKRIFFKAAAAGSAAALPGTVLWAIVADGHDFFYTMWIALLTAFLVGSSVRHFAKENDRAFGFLAAGLSFFGCLLGVLVNDMHRMAEYLLRRYRGDILATLGELFHNPDRMEEVLSKNLSALGLLVSLLICTLAAYLGYRFALRRGAGKRAPFLEGRMDKVVAFGYVFMVALCVVYTISMFYAEY